jgi:hypothetical protein
MQPSADMTCHDRPSSPEAAPPNNLAARIMLEHDCRNIPFEVTCAIQGWLVHTQYVG